MQQRPQSSSRCRQSMLLLAAAAAAAALARQEAAGFVVVSPRCCTLGGGSPLASLPKATSWRLASLPELPAGARETASRAAAATAAAAGSHFLDGESIQGPLQPLRGMVLLQKLVSESSTKGGLLLPTDSRQSQLLGRVISTGPGEWDAKAGQRVSGDVKEGELVIFSKHAGEQLKYDGDDCILISSEDLLAKVEGSSGELLAASEVKPLGDTVFVRVLKPAEKTSGGLLLMPQQQNSRVLQQALVVATGPGRISRHHQRLPIDVAPGDRVLYSSYAQDASELRLGEDVFAFVKGGELSARW